jgi:hypothetical protein
VKSVAADPILIELLSQRVAVGDLGVAAMEGRVEALSARMGPRLFGWWRGAGGESLEPLDHGVVDEDRSAVVRSAMHDPMSDGGGKASDLGTQELHDLA